MKRILRWLIALIVVSVASGGLYVYSVWQPDMPAEMVARVHHIDALHGGYTPLAKIPRFLQEAVIATEDRSFYHNQGIDFEGIARALWVDAVHMKPLEGASTITEQLVKDIFLTDQKTVGRKLKQIALALMVSRTLTKNQVLSLYLNEVYLGHGAYGVGAAARIYFAESATALTPAQCAVIAGLPQAPSAYDPLLHLQLAKHRQAEVLQSMVSAKDLSPTAAADIARQPLYLT